MIDHLKETSNREIITKIVEKLSKLSEDNDKFFSCLCKLCQKFYNSKSNSYAEHILEKISDIIHIYNQKSYTYDDTVVCQIVQNRLNLFEISIYKCFSEITYRKQNECLSALFLSLVSSIQDVSNSNPGKFKIPESTNLEFSEFTEKPSYSSTDFQHNVEYQSIFDTKVPGINSCLNYSSIFNENFYEKIKLVQMVFQSAKSYLTDIFFSNMSKYGFLNDDVQPYLCFLLLLQESKGFSTGIFDAIINYRIFDPSIHMFCPPKDYEYIAFIRQLALQTVVAKMPTMLPKVLEKHVNHQFLFSELCLRIQSMIKNGVVFEDRHFTLFIEVEHKLRKIYEISEDYREIAIKARSSIFVLIYSIMNSPAITEASYSSKYFSTCFLTAFFEPHFSDLVFEKLRSVFQVASSEIEQTTDFVANALKTLKYNTSTSYTSSLASRLLASVGDSIPLNTSLALYCENVLKNAIEYTEAFPSQSFLTQIMQLSLQMFLYHLDFEYDLITTTKVSKIIRQLEGPELSDAIKQKLLCFLSASQSVHQNFLSLIRKPSVLTLMFSVYSCGKHFKELFKLLNDLINYSSYNLLMIHKGEVDLILCDMVSNFPNSFFFRGCEIDNFSDESEIINMIMPLFNKLISIKSSTIVAQRILNIMNPKDGKFNPLVFQFLSQFFLTIKTIQNLPSILYPIAMNKTFWSVSNLNKKNFFTENTISFWIKVDQALANPLNKKLSILRGNYSDGRHFFEISIRQSHVYFEINLGEKSAELQIAELDNSNWNCIAIVFRRVPDKKNVRITARLNQNKPQSSTIDSCLDQDDLFSINFGNNCEINQIDTEKLICSYQISAVNCYSKVISSEESDTVALNSLDFVLPNVPVLFSFNIKEKNPTDKKQKTSVQIQELFGLQNVHKIMPNINDIFSNYIPMISFVPVFGKLENSPKDYSCVLVDFIFYCFGKQILTVIDEIPFYLAKSPSEILTYQLYRRFYNLIDLFTTNDELAVFVNKILMNGELWAKSPPSTIQKVLSHWSTALIEIIRENDKILNIDFYNKILSVYRKYFFLPDEKKTKVKEIKEENNDYENPNEMYNEMKEIEFDKNNNLQNEKVTNDQKVTEKQNILENKNSQNDNNLDQKVTNHQNILDENKIIQNEKSNLEEKVIEISENQDNKSDLDQKSLSEKVTESENLQNEKDSNNNENNVQKVTNKNDNFQLNEKTKRISQSSDKSIEMKKQNISKNGLDLNMILFFFDRLISELSPNFYNDDLIELFISHGIFCENKTLTSRILGLLPTLLHYHRKCPIDVTQMMHLVSLQNQKEFIFIFLYSIQVFYPSELYKQSILLGYHIPQDIKYEDICSFEGELNPLSAFPIILIVSLRSSSETQKSILEKYEHLTTNKDNCKEITSHSHWYIWFILFALQVDPTLHPRSSDVLSNLILSDFDSEVTERIFSHLDVLRITTNFQVIKIKALITKRLYDCLKSDSKSMPFLISFCFSTLFMRLTRSLHNDSLISIGFDSKFHDDWKNCKLPNRFQKLTSFNQIKNAFYLPNKLHCSYRLHLADNTNIPNSQQYILNILLDLLDKTPLFTPILHVIQLISRYPRGNFEKKSLILKIVSEREFLVLQGFLSERFDKLKSICSIIHSFFDNFDFVLNEINSRLNHLTDPSFKYYDEIKVINERISNNIVQDQTEMKKSLKHLNNFDCCQMKRIISHDHFHEEFQEPSNFVQGRRIKLLKEYEIYVYVEDKKLILYYDGKKVKIDPSDVQAILWRSPMHIQTGVEIYLKTGKRYFIDFSPHKNSVFFNLLKDFKFSKKCIIQNVPYKEFVKEQDLLHQFQSSQISTFEFLLKLNLFSGRTFSDYKLYPFFPILEMNFDGQYTKRDFRLPIIAQTPDKQKFFKNQLEDKSEDRFNLGVPMSSPIFVGSFLYRIEPFLSLNKILHENKVEDEEFLFTSISNYCNLIKTTNEDREATPEFFTLPEAFKGFENKFNDYIEWVYNNRKVLNSSGMKLEICNWVDSNFGFAQRGKSAIERYNVFLPFLYEDAWSKISDNETNMAKELMSTLGIVPPQIFTEKINIDQFSTPFSDLEIFRSLSFSQFFSHNNSNNNNINNTNSSNNCNFVTSEIFFENNIQKIVVLTTDNKLCILTSDLVNKHISIDKTFDVESAKFLTSSYFSFVYLDNSHTLHFHYKHQNIEIKETEDIKFIDHDYKTITTATLNGIVKVYKSDKLIRRFNVFCDEIVFIKTSDKFGIVVTATADSFLSIYSIFDGNIINTIHVEGFVKCIDITSEFGFILCATSTHFYIITVNGTVDKSIRILRDISMICSWISPISFVDCVCTSDSSGSLTIFEAFYPDKVLLTASSGSCVTSMKYDNNLMGIITLTSSMNLLFFPFY
ncbi:Beige/BEACH domain containing protein [Trichomonas vaginalis G3]|uniref:Beige/BEACH domain containing protein n=1 Tax=Trichomonas vaginalis (strain ATCC PRA-98 / G3) TaxID=412133 RepID=A2DVS7_TRIV3|nr:platelet formation protein family [Trichomonas vaginalis G3]EAY15490.1 Beige/BEACH domain containing protein [Trichomonas vaginalis G3]KAI5511500.1 platelet formation protein family [Trichomonas vaginalis G3]|eukprot:XP_001327713.1 Beige/BEACH domain containing protein [Trichomonas vaginalis G3]